jgi:inhibitor of cysteine peptidase
MSELRLTQADKGKSFEVHRDDVIAIYLKENPTTGYQWAVHEADDRILELQRTEFSLPEDPKIGQGGMRVFIFKAKTVGTGQIQLKHYREWEGDGSIIERFDVTVVLRE